MTIIKRVKRIVKSNINDTDKISTGSNIHVHADALLRNVEGMPGNFSVQIEIGGTLICTYKADFVYFARNRRVIEDVKGYRTPLYRLKKKLVEALYRGTVIQEVKP